ncbi:2-isopropylmalate synthase [Victivallis vadensis]|uniref:2-isopropylmalate synthase n=1 Tax=Victivallis vadensis TaxID=172901 RepID=UPI002671E096|nr:2-isopropylmalate synthase [Victivallis vadensis]
MEQYPKYRASEPIAIENRVWPTRRITRPPTWVSVDLRDGNQAFARPMNVAAKIRYFQMLTQIGFKEIEVAYPASSAEEFEFVRRLIMENLIPDDVRISVLTAARENLIARTIESLQGVRQATIHCYVATSDLHREFVFHKTEAEITEMAVSATKMIAEALEQNGMRDAIHYEFSPEEFSDSRLGFIVDLASAVHDAWRPNGKADFILNLPATVERRPPYEYADMVEAFTRSYPYMADTTLSVHTHNDQGGAVAAAEMAVLAGAERVEGTLCGHGERTGNMDLVMFALNLKSRGVDPGLDFSNLPEIVEFIEEVSDIRIHPRAPYTGELVFTAFSGTHQDAIRKGMAQREEISARFKQGWKMPYLHLDPADIGRNYDGLIRINSQSGKGGIAYILESVYGISIPKPMQPVVAREVQRAAEASGNEVSAVEIHRIFMEKFVDAGGKVRIGGFRIQRPAPTGVDQTGVELELKVGDSTYAVLGTGSGPIEAAVAALNRCPALPDFQVESYSEHALGRGSSAQAIAFIGLKFEDSETIVYGVGVNANINLAAIGAIAAALNRR